MYNFLITCNFMQKNPSFNPNTFVKDFLGKDQHKYGHISL